VKVDVRNSYKMIVVDLTGSRRNNTNTILRCILIELSAWIFILLSTCEFYVHGTVHPYNTV